MFKSEATRLANVKTEQLPVLNDASVRRDHTAVSRDVECVLIARRAPERAGRAADGGLFRPCHSRAAASRVEAYHRLCRMGRDVERTGSANSEVVAENIRGCRFDRSRTAIGLQRRAQKEPASGVADPDPAGPNLDAVRAREPWVVRLENFVRQPSGPATGFTQVDGQDPPRQAFACEQRLAIRVKSKPLMKTASGRSVQCCTEPSGPIFHM